MNPETIPPLAANQDERVMAALSHVSALLPLMGLIAPVIIWVTQREKSRFVAFQSLQALAFQLTMILVWFVGWSCYVCSYFSPLLTLPFADSTSPLPLPAFFELLLLGLLNISFIVFGGMFLIEGLLIVYGFVGAIQTLRGRDFRYFLLGSRVERYMQTK